MIGRETQISDDCQARRHRNYVSLRTYHYAADQDCSITSPKLLFDVKSWELDALENAMTLQVALLQTGVRQEEHVRIVPFESAKNRTYGPHSAVEE